MKKDKSFFSDNCYGLIEGKIYSVNEILKNFKDYFGISFEEMKQLFSASQIPFDSNRIDSKKRQTCDCLWKQQLAILSHKAMNYLYLLEYIANDNNVCFEDEWTEKILEQLEIFHFGRGMTGLGINQLLFPLSHLMRQIQALLQKINSVDANLLDNLAIYYEENKMYLLDNMVSSCDRIEDKTSLKNAKRMKKII